MTRIVALLALLAFAGCTAFARPIAPVVRPQAVLGAIASPATTVAPVTADPAPIAARIAAPLTPAPTIAPGPPAASAAEAAQRVAQAIDALDLPAMRRLMYGGGWQFAYPGGDVSLRLLPREAVDWLRKRTPDGKIRAVIDASQVLATTADHPAGRSYVRSEWVAFDGKDRVRVDIVLTQDSDGAWYWSGILIDAP